MWLNRKSDIIYLEIKILNTEFVFRFNKFVKNIPIVKIRKVSFCETIKYWIKNSKNWIEIKCLSDNN